MSDGPTLIGEYVTLRAISIEEDTNKWFEAMLEPDMHVWTGNRIPNDITDVIELLMLYKNHEDIISWSIVSNKDHDMVGTYWIVKPVHQDGKLIIADEAQRIAKHYWRNGYTKEARKLVYEYAFHQLEVDEIHAHAWKENVSSCRSMESAGFRLIDKSERLFNKYDKIFEECHYVLQKQEWIKSSK